MAGILASCSDIANNVVEPEGLITEEASSQDSAIYETGEIIVYFSEDMAEMIEKSLESGSVITRSADLNSAFSSIGVNKMERLFPYAGEYEERTRAEGLHRWYKVSYSETVPYTRSSADLIDIDGVEFVEPVRRIKIADFNDLTPELWGLWNRDNPGFDINVKPVWNEYTTGNSKVIVSVVDTGIDLYHEDLSDNCLSKGHYNSVNGTTYIEAGEHGTHVAGTIAAVSNNGKGIAGIAGGDKQKGIAGVSLMSSQIFSADGTGAGGSSAKAIKQAADDGAVISQNSWGYNFDTDGDGELTGEEYTRAMNASISASDKAAVDYFIKYAGCDNKGNQLPGSPMKGGIVIFAAGNDGIENGAPATYENVIAVGAVSSNGDKASFSNYGDWVDICAPGTAIRSTVPNNGYENLQGTSMACPHVSGVAALLVSYFGGPGFTNEMLKEKLLKSSNTEAISKYKKIGGLVDAYGAFVYGNDKAPGNITDLKVNGIGNNIDLTMTLPSDEDGKAAYGVMVIFSKDKTAVENASEKSLNGVDYRLFAPEAASGEEITLRMDELEFSQQYYLKALAYSYGRSYSAATEVFNVSTTENHAPEMAASAESKLTLLPHEKVTVTITVSDPDGHDFTVTHEKGSEAENLMKQPDGTWKLTITGKDADFGTYKAVVTAEDKYGFTGKLEIEYTIKENSAPVKIKDPESVFMKAKGEEQTIDMSAYISDPDNEQLKFDATLSNAKVANVFTKGSSLVITALAYGTSDITVTGKDARGEKAEVSFKILVKDPSKPVSVYPNPVKDFVNIGTLDLADTDITIISQTGRTMFNDTMKASALEPARIDMTSYAPGAYKVIVTLSGKEYEETVVKL